MTGTQWLLLISFAVTLIFACLLLIDAITEGRVKGKMSQLAAAYRRFSSSGALPERYQRLPLGSFTINQRLPLSSSSTNQRVVWLKQLVLGMLVILSVILFGLLLTRGERAVQSTSTQSATPGDVSSSAGRSPASDLRSASGEGKIIQLADVLDSARSFQTVRIQGMYRGGADTFLRVQRWEGGQWLAFPLPTKTDQSGRFTAYVELGQPGRYRLRVLDPESGVKSKPFVLVIKS
jgi:hypothetical protein